MVPGGFFQGRTDHHANTHRLAYTSLLKPDSFTPAASLAGGGGVRFAANSFKVLAQTTPNMSVRMTRGLGSIPGLEANTQGNYVIANDAEINPIAIGASHITLERIDLIYIYTNDAQYSGALNKDDFGLIVGTNAAVGSAVPNFGALPTNVAAMAQVLVSPGVTSIVQAKITDLRSFYTCQGGVAIARPFNISSAGIDYGDLRYYNGRIESWNADPTTGWRPVGVDNQVYNSSGITYGLYTSSSVVGTISIPDPGYPYFIEGMFSANCNSDNTTTRWDIVLTLDTSGGAFLANGICAIPYVNRTSTYWFRSAVQTGAHSVVVNFNRVTGINAAVNGEAVYYFKIVPQAPAANNGLMVNV